MAAGKAALLAVIALLVGATANAAAATGGAGTPVSGPSAGSGAGAPVGEASTGNISLVTARTWPRKGFYFGFHYPKLTFVLASDQPENDIRIDVLNAAGEAVKTFYRSDVAPNSRYRIRWDGTDGQGRPARNGRYSFRVGPQTPAPSAPRYARRATRESAVTLGFKLFGFAFPVIGRHDFGGASARFGAGRSGHTHQGQDILANCGQTIVAARGGRVRYSKYQSAAGNYVVIDGKGSGWDMMYAHLTEPSPLKPGDVVRTGQPIGIVGRTGDASACHLHFEIWGPPGWYEGGSPFDPLPLLLKWDRYS
ncbi:MAG: peptidoglycan DD-metalloendopeptidase family protein [Solirubrobacterales bacterium]